MTPTSETTRWREPKEGDNQMANKDVRIDEVGTRVLQSAFTVRKVTKGRIHGVCAMSGVHFTSHIIAQTENGGCVRDSDGNWYGVIKDGRIRVELELAYERHVLPPEKRKLYKEAI
jgi:hypothetical protein